jgi:hypothetical protein
VTHAADRDLQCRPDDVRVVDHQNARHMWILLTRDRGTCFWRAGEKLPGFAG